MLWHMRVDDILIHSLGFVDNGARVVGDVAVHVTLESGGAEKAHVERLTCSVAASSRIQPEAALIGDAIRQMRRNPAVRLGFERLHFAKGLKPLSPFEGPTAATGQTQAA